MHFSTVFACMVVCAIAAVSFTQGDAQNQTPVTNNTNNSTTTKPQSMVNPSVTAKPPPQSAVTSANANPGTANINGTGPASNQQDANKSPTNAPTPGPASNQQGANKSSTIAPTPGPDSNTTTNPGNSGESLHLPSLITMMLTVCALLYGFTGNM